jgi:enoyl-CoA hydratase/carnithine racemase
MSAEHLRVELIGHTLVLTLNRPGKMNAISREMISIWTEALVRARMDDSVRVVVITGEGSAFCAGGDFAVMGRKAGQEGDGKFPPVDDKLDRGIHRVAIAMEDLDKPVIAAVNGPAIGAGLGMALMADLRFFSDRARVAEGYIDVGLFPGNADTYFLPPIVGTSQALMMFWTGSSLEAAECLEVGIANRVFAHETLMSETFDFAEVLAGKSQIDIRAIKRATYASLNSTLRDHLGLVDGYCAVVNSSQERTKALETFMAVRAHDRGA